jgi:hypothetical protein
MIAAISGPLRSRRIHIGMDEAHGVSEGRYRQLFGYKESTEVVRPPFLLRSSFDNHADSTTDSSPPTFVK